MLKDRPLLVSGAWLLSLKPSKSGKHKSTPISSALQTGFVVSQSLTSTHDLSGQVMDDRVVLPEHLNERVSLLLHRRLSKHPAKTMKMSFNVHAQQHTCCILSCETIFISVRGICLLWKKESQQEALEEGQKYV